MFGLGKKEDRQNMQVPYEVYETVHEPAARRRRLIVRLIAALIVVTLLVFGAIALQRALSDDADPPADSSQQANDQPAQDTPQRVDSPQPAPSTPPPSPQPTPPSDGSVNNGTVGKPE